MGNTEAMLFVDDNESEVVKGNVFLEEGMCADNNACESAPNGVFQGFFGDGFRTEYLRRPCEQGDLHWFRSEPF